MSSTPLRTTLFDYTKIHVHWFPSHMNAGYIPQSSASPLLGPLALGREHFIAFAKADLADPLSNARLERFAQQRWPNRAFLINTLEPRSLHPLLHRLAHTVYEKSPPPSSTCTPASRRLLIVGIPNVGKSSLLNQLRALGTGRGGKATRTGDLPGVTRRLSGTITLLEGPPRLMMVDTPGILMPRIQDVQQGMKLAITGAIMDALLNDHLLADYLLHTLRMHQSEKESNESCVRVLGLEEAPRDALDLIESVSRASGWSVVNAHNAVRKMLRAFRDGRLGRFTLDSIPEYPDHTEEGARNADGQQ